MFGFSSEWLIGGIYKSRVYVHMLERNEILVHIIVSSGGFLRELFSKELY